MPSLHACPSPCSYCHRVPPLLQGQCLALCILRAPPLQREKLPVPPHLLPVPSDLSCDLSNPQTSNQLRTKQPGPISVCEQSQGSVCNQDQGLKVLRSVSALNSAFVGRGSNHLWLPGLTHQGLRYPWTTDATQNSSQASGGQCSSDYCSAPRYISILFPSSCCLMTLGTQPTGSLSHQGDVF